MFSKPRLLILLASVTASIIAAIYGFSGDFARLDTVILIHTVIFDTITFLSLTYIL